MTNPPDNSPSTDTPTAGAPEAEAPVTTAPTETRDAGAPQAEALPRVRSPWLGRVAIAVGLACVLGIALLFFNVATGKGADLFSTLALAAVGIVSVVTAIIANRDMSLSLTNPRGWLTRTNIAGFVMALIFGVSTMGTLLPILDPPVAVESPPGAIQDTVEAIAETLDRRLPAPAEIAPIRTRLPGLWGEPGCAVAWRFSLDGAALVADVERRPPELPPYTLVASVTAEEGLTLQAVGESPEAARGMAATFTLDDSGVAPRLAWSDRTRDTPLILQPCAG